MIYWAQVIRQNYLKDVMFVNGIKEILLKIKKHLIKCINRIQWGDEYFNLDVNIIFF